MSERVRRELQEVVALLTAAEEIANGLVGVCEHAYDHDHRSSPALAAANAVAVALSEELATAEDRLARYTEAWS